MNCKNCQQPCDACQCNPCPEPIQPILPRCQDVVLPDGTFRNATVSIKNGCIVDVQEGVPFQYAPDGCAPVASNGGTGNQDCDCPPGEDGAPATVDVGQTYGIAYGEQPRVVNVGTTQNAVFDFYIPRGERGEAATPPGGGSAGSDEGCGIVIEDGLVKETGLMWPPMMNMEVTTDTSYVTAHFTKDCTSKLQMNFQGLIDHVTSLINNITPPGGGGGGGTPAPPASGGWDLAVRTINNSDFAVVVGPPGAKFRLGSLSGPYQNSFNTEQTIPGDGLWRGAVLQPAGQSTTDKGFLVAWQGTQARAVAKFDAFHDTP